MIPNIKIVNRKYPTELFPFLHVVNYRDNTIGYYTSFSEEKQYSSSIGVWKPKKMLDIKK